MNLKQAIINNAGMQQDVSISKEGKDFAYKNVNIRIQSTGDGSLASITNLKSPLKIEGKNIISMEGKVLNSIMCGKYIVVFTHSDTSTYKDYIYRIDLENDFSVNELYKGDLNFSYDKPIDSTFYYENDKIQKVYWVDGWTTNGKNNYPRVINIISDGERNGDSFTTYDASTNFDFYPEIKSIPNVSAVKNFDIPSEIPSGTIQYFVSYFNKNNSETLIASGTFLYTVDLKAKGASPEEKGCAFNITISNVSSEYEYIRLYSVKRTSFDGEVIVSIVKDIKIINGKQSYSVTDNGIGQETLDPSQIFFVGGTPLFARTLCQKDNTLFLGGIKTNTLIIPNDIKSAINDAIKLRESGLKEAVILEENYKSIPTSESSFNAYYPYKLQKDNESILHKTFKTQEIYRFGIQFQDKQGQWSEVVWIGDKKILNYPVYKEGTNDFDVSNIRFSTRSAIITEEQNLVQQQYLRIFEELKGLGFENYRLLMADPENSNGRSILAQGVVCPTMFSPSLRSSNSPHTLNSWVMRPRNGAAPNHHLEPLHPARKAGSELSTYDPSTSPPGFPLPFNSWHNMPFEFVSTDSDNYSKTSADNNFYVDESIVGLYSPEILSDTIISQNPKFRIIGIAPLHTNYSFAETQTQNIGLNLDYTPGIDGTVLNNYKVEDGSDSVISPLYSEYMYVAPKWYDQAEFPDVAHRLNVYGKDTSLYNIHMWQHSKSIIGFNISEDKVKYSDDEDVTLTEEPLILKSNYFYNHLFSKNSIYFYPVQYDINFGVSVYKDNDIKFKQGDSYLYKGNFDYIHVNQNTNIYREDQWSRYHYRDKIVPASSRITFDGIPHAVFYLGTANDKIQILPRFTNELAYNGIFTGKYDIDRNLWNDISTNPSVTNNEIYLRNYFNKLLSAPGAKLGASWIDNLALYRAGTKEDVFDSITRTYKTCCAIQKAGDPGAAVKYYLTGPDKYKVLKNYNYKETINGEECFVVIHFDSASIVTKCYWSINDTSANNVHTATLSDRELILYPLLYGDYIPGVDPPSDWCVNVWEASEPLPPSQPYYKFLKTYKVWDPDSDDYLRKGSVALNKNFIVFNDDYIYTQSEIDIDCPSNKPYLFIGELFYDIDYQDLYGGDSKEALSNLTWIPISKTTKLFDGDKYYVGFMGMVDKTGGDTYYQRWDCLKTFPKTTEDMNSVVDITSFMVETHINLDDRYDSNRATFNNIVTPANFNLFNTAYNQKNNLFSYSTINSLLTEENSHQVVWSLSKNISGIVDTWTNINSTNVVNLKHPVTKLVNFNNKVVGITDHSVEVINYNAKNLIPTEGNTFIELQNSSKVDGTIDFTINKGSRNMSVLVTEAGLYFIDDNENSLIRINYDGGIKNIALGKLDSWFKQNTVPGTYTKNNSNAFHLEYDSKYKDVYICNDNIVVVYNETLDSFTSFIDYQELVSLFTDTGKTYAISFDGNSNSNDLYCLYEGDTYGYGFYEKPLPYSIQYRVNPGPYSDKVFTNVEFKADLNVTKINSTTSNVKPFNTIQVWNEYQDTGVQPLVYDRLSNLKDKFRTWRATIPRNKKGDKNTWRDRIRNPWIHLKLDNTDVNGQKLEFHNITVTYME